MKSFIYIGDPNTDDEAQKGPKEISFRGVTFKAGKASPVEDEATIKKLRGNSHFKEVKANEAPAPKPDGEGDDGNGKEPTTKKPAPKKAAPAPKPDGEG